MSERPSRRLRIHGRVQGVGFRYALLEEATRLGLSGWVRNRRDGTVEALASGPAPALDALAQWCHRGPPSASVSRVEVERLAEEPDLPSFTLRPTA